MFLLWHPSLTAINLSYTFPILETSATALCGTTGNHVIQNLWLFSYDGILRPFNRIQDIPAKSLEGVEIHYLSLRCKEWCSECWDDRVGHRNGIGTLRFRKDDTCDMWSKFHRYSLVKCQSISDVIVTSWSSIADMFWQNDKRRRINTLWRILG